MLENRCLMKRLTNCVLLILILAGLVGCRANFPQAAESFSPGTQTSLPNSEGAASGLETPSPSAEPGPYTFTDELGNEITVNNPQRVVALMGGFAETWILAGGKLCGVTDDAVEERGLDLPSDVAVVGKYNSPNVEEIIALNPELVILSSETEAHMMLRDTLENAGIIAAYFKVTYFEDYLAMLETCTQITGRDDLYERNGRMVKDKIDDVQSDVSDEEHPSVLFLITFSGGVRVQNSSTMTGRMLFELGCENIADKNASLLKEFSIEGIISEDPDYIFVVPMGNDDELAMRNLRESIEQNPAWNGLTAVKSGRYILLPKDKFLYKPNVRWNESYEHLRDILYGQA